MPNPATRTIVLQWLNNQMAGDELLEIWKKLAAVWSLDATIPVDSTPEQTHEFAGSPGSAYAFQVRARRDGVYRPDYQSSNPDDWPAVSLLAYTAGLPTGVLAFVGWARTSGVAQHLSFTFSNIDPARATKFYRDDGGGYDLIATIPAGTATYDFPITTESATSCAFKITQENDDLVATPSAPVTVWCGPQAPTSLETDPASGYTNIFYGYHVQWATGTGGASTKVQDDYCGAFQTRTTSGAGITDRLETGLPKFSAHAPNGNVPVTVHVRIRHEITAFAVTDVSDWVQIPVPVDIASDETAYGAC